MGVGENGGVQAKHVCTRGVNMYVRTRGVTCTYQRGNMYVPEG